MKEQIIRKLSSRKFWVTVVGVAAGVLMAFGGEGSEIKEIARMTASVNKDAVFDTNRKSLLRHISAEKGLK